MRVSMTQTARSRLRHGPGLLACLLAVQLIGAAVPASAADEGPVVYCRDAARGIVLRVLVGDCPPGNVVTEKEADALRNESIERRRRLMMGGKPDAATTAPESAPQVNVQPPAPAPEQPKPAAV